MKLSPLVKNILLLLLLGLLGGLFSLAEGHDSFWDLRNYHLYIPFAFLNGRWGIDLMPAGIHTFLNPLLDIPYYLMVVYLNNYPKLTAFLQGLPYGLFCFAGYKTCLLFLEEKEGKTTALLAAILGLTGSMTLSQAGLSYKHTAIADVILAALIWQMTSIPNWGKTDFADKVIDLDGLPKLENNALVVYFGPEMSFLSPFFTAGTKFVGGITFPVEKYPAEYQKQAEQLNWFSPAYHQHKFKDDILRTISAHDGPIYIVAVYWPMMLDPITLSPYGLKADEKDCAPVNVNNSHIWNVCKVQKLETVSVPLT